MSEPPPESWTFESNYNEDGVDMTLIAHMLSLSPLERLQLMERHARDIKWLHEHARRIPDAGPPPSR
jgi:hypothetical protein